MQVYIRLGPSITNISTMPPLSENQCVSICGVSPADLKNDDITALLWWGEKMQNLTYSYMPNKVSHFVCKYKVYHIKLGDWLQSHNNILQSCRPYLASSSRADHSSKAIQLGLISIKGTQNRNCTFVGTKECRSLQVITLLEA